MEYLVISELDRKLRGTMELLWAGSLVRRRLSGYLDPESKQEEEESGQEDIPQIAPARLIEVSEEQNGETITANVGDTVVVTLSGNQTTRYEWQASSFSKSLPVVTTEYVSCKPVLTGSGGFYKFYLRPDELSAGFTHGTDFSYYRPWEGSADAIRTFSINIMVPKVEHDHHPA